MSSRNRRTTEWVRRVTDELTDQLQKRVARRLSSAANKLLPGDVEAGLETARRVHLKRLACLVIAVLLAGAALHALHTYQVHRSAADLLAHVERCERAGDVAGADEFLRQYVRLVPGDLDALVRLALRRAETATTPLGILEASFLLERVVARDASRSDIRLLLVRKLVEIGRFGDASEQVAELQNSNPDDPEVLRLLARVETGRAHYQEAIAAYRQVIELDPGDESSYVELAELLRERLAQPEESDAVMDQLVAANSASADAYVARARYGLKHNQRQRAEQDVASATELAPQHVGALQLAAEVAIDQRRYGRGREQLERAVELAPANASLYLSLSRLDLAEGRAEQALATIQRGLEHVRDDPQLLWTLVELHTAAGRWDEATRQIEQLAGSGLSPSLVEHLKASLLYAQGDYMRASRLLERVLSRLSDRPDLEAAAASTLADCYRMMGQPDRAVVQWRRVMRLQPVWPAPRWKLVQELAAMRQFDEALAECELARALGPPEAAQWALYLRLLIRRESWRPAAEQSWENCELVRRQAEQAWPAAPELIGAVADLLAAQGNVQQAIDHLSDTVRQHPAELKLRIVLAQHYDRAGRTADAHATLDSAERELGDTAALRLARMERLDLAETPGDALQQLAAGLEGFSRHDQLNLLRGLGLAAVRLRLWDLAGQYVTQLAALADYDLGSRLLLVDLALRAKDDAALRRWVLQIRAIEGNEGLLWRYGEAWRLILAAESGTVKELPLACELLEQIRIERPSWGRVYVSIARAEELRRRAGPAIDAYQTAISLGEQDPEIISRLIWLLASQGRYIEADRMVRRLEESVAMPAAMQRLAAEVFARSGDFHAAIQQAQRYAAAHADDYLTHVWLGQLLRVMGRLEEAEAALREATRVAPQELGAWVPLLIFMVQTAQRDEANGIIAHLRVSLPRARVEPGLAVCFEVIGDLEQAEAHHRTAVAIHSEDLGVLRAAADFYARQSRWNEAAALLRRAHELEPQDASLRRSLAVALGAKGDYASWQQATKLTDSNLQEAPGSVDDRRVKATLLASRNNVRHQQAAIAILEELVSHVIPAPADRRLLAQLYAARGDRPRAQDMLLGLAAQYPNNRDYVAAYAKLSLERRDLAETEKWLERLEQLDATSLETTLLKTRLLTAQQQRAEARELLDRCVARLADSAQDVAQLDEIARCYDQIGETEAAGAVYRQYYAASAEGALPLLEWLTRHGKLDEAAAVCDEAWAKLPTEAVSALCMLLVRSHGISTDQLLRVESRLLAALQRQRDAVALRLALAALRDAQARYADAAALYQQVLQRDPQNPLALNNLAWLLSQIEGDHSAALVLIETAIQHHGPSPDLLDTRGVIRMGMGDSPRAMRDLEEAYASSPQPHIAFHLAQAYRQAGQQDRARQILRTTAAPDVVLPQLHACEHQSFRQLLTVLQDVHKDQAETPGTPRRAQNSVDTGRAGP
jgi:tetratricopeptide (TPR) repeat protein